MTEHEKHIQELWKKYILDYCYGPYKKINKAAAIEALVGALEMLKFDELIDEFKKIIKN